MSTSGDGSGQEHDVLGNAPGSGDTLGNAPNVEDTVGDAPKAPTAPAPPPAPAPANRTPMLVGIVVAVLAVLGALAIYLVK